MTENRETPTLAWDASYSIGEATLDAQHRGLLELIADFIARIEAGEAEAAGHEIMPRLADYADEHFRAEETLFREYGFPDGGTHVLQHEDFRRIVATLGMAVEAGRGRAVLELCRFLQDWLTEHILGEDKSFGIWLGEVRSR